MAIILFVFVPIGWVLTAWLLGAAVSFSVPTAAGKRYGSLLGRWCRWLFPALYFLLYFLGVSGDAGNGVRLFGSEDLFGLLCLPFYAVPVLGLYVAALFVIRDLIRGLRSQQS